MKMLLIVGSLLAAAVAARVGASVALAAGFGFDTSSRGGPAGVSFGASVAGEGNGIGSSAYQQYERIRQTLTVGRYRNGERISIGFLKSTANQMVSNRFYLIPQIQHRRWYPDPKPNLSGEEFPACFKIHWPGGNLSLMKVRAAQGP